MAIELAGVLDMWASVRWQIARGPERDKDALKVGGENVSARQVEDACRAVGGIADIAVVGRSHEMLDQVPVAFVVRAALGEGQAHRFIDGEFVGAIGTHRRLFSCILRAFRQ